MNRRKITSTKNLVHVINANPDIITKVEMQSDSYLVEEINVDDFKRDLMTLSQSGIFADTIEWKYEKILFPDNQIIVYGCICPYLGTQLRIYLQNGMMHEVDEMLSKTVFS